MCSCLPCIRAHMFSVSHMRCSPNMCCMYFCIMLGCMLLCVIWIYCPVAPFTVTRINMSEAILLNGSKYKKPMLHLYTHIVDTMPYGFHWIECNKWTNGLFSFYYSGYSHPVAYAWEWKKKWWSGVLSSFVCFICM